jgi:hypothetical protein
MDRGAELLRKSALQKRGNPSLQPLADDEPAGEEDDKSHQNEAKSRESQSFRPDLTGSRDEPLDR